MGGPNLEIFKFGMYIMFPIGWMYYFGTNLDNKFSIKDFWPTKEQLNSVPTEKSEIEEEIERLKKRRLLLRERRLEEEAREAAHSKEGTAEGMVLGGPLDRIGDTVAKAVEREGRGWSSWIKSR